jgi:DNA-binding NarL/FixJ family response regulator
MTTPNVPCRWKSRRFRIGSSDKWDSALGSQSGFEIVCECVNASGAVEKTEVVQPDLVILDISLPDMDGLEVVRRIRAVSPSTEILLCSEHPHMVRAGLKAGARRYLLKSDAVRELIVAVRTVMRRERYIRKRLAATL